ncbi:hypothetical protein KR222_009087 [Zaprionus bogoriensis]|nr:hypothetical protein KR222_009087 [Zaprionus bogoriensis]
MLQCNKMSMLLQLVLIPIIFATAARKTDVLKQIITTANKQRPIETFLIVDKQKAVNSLPKDFTLPDLPTVRFSGSTRIDVKKAYNSEALALLCMSEIADTMTLRLLSVNLNRMRETRIIIWLQSDSSSALEILKIICEKANEYKFPNILVLHSTPHAVAEPLILYRLQLFPTPSFQRFEGYNVGVIFPRINLNFQGKVAVILPDLIYPRSMLTTNLRTGREQFMGSSDRLIMEFAKRRNIQLKLHKIFNKNASTDASITIKLTLNNELDLPIRPFPRISSWGIDNIENILELHVESMFIVVPCKCTRCIGDIYIGLRTYAIIVFGAYFSFAVLETFIVATTYRIFGRRFRLSYSSLFVNLRVFSGLLGLPVRLESYRKSLALQQIVMVMSLFSLILTCLFNANLSTLLTRQPRCKQIRSFEELASSGLLLNVDDNIKAYIESELNATFFTKVVPHFKPVNGLKRIELLLAFDTRYAHFSTSVFWKSVDRFQRHYNRKILCKSDGLTIVRDIPYSGIINSNSVYKLALEEFILWTRSMGLNNHWELQAGRKMIASFYPAGFAENRQDIKPLSLHDLKLLWSLMGVCYTLVGCVFLTEICVARRRNRRNSVVCV